MLGLACSEAYEFGQLGTGLSRFNTVPKADEFFKRNNGIPERDAVSPITVGSPIFS